MTRPLVALAALLAVLTWSSGCSPEAPPALRVEETRILVQNQTGEAWPGVEVWVNDHYRVQVPSLAPRQMAVIPLDTFVAGFGQRFDRKRQAVYGVEVRARSGSGFDTKLVWGKGKKKY